ncbi:MAG: acyl-CoA dehydrogenase family protein [Acidobacteriaceae bacterium]
MRNAVGDLSSLLYQAGNSQCARLYASEVAVKICDESVQLHGGCGFIKDYPAEKFYRLHAAAS